MKMIEIKDNVIAINTKGTSLIFEIKDFHYAGDDPKNKRKIVLQNYFGKRMGNKTNETPLVINDFGSNLDYVLGDTISSTFGWNNTEPSLLLFNGDGTYVNRFYFVDAVVRKGPKEMKGPHARDVAETLEIIEKDDVMDLELHHCYSVFEDSDVIVVKKELVNKGKKPCSIRKIASLETHLPTNEVTIYTYDGSWLYERFRHENKLKDGTFSTGSIVGSSSHKHNPYIEVVDDKNGTIYGFNLIYSGNHKETVIANQQFDTTVMVGINDFAFDWLLEPGASFITPEAIMLVKDNQNELTKEMHNFASNHVIRAEFRNKERPIIYNSWEGLMMTINEENLLHSAELSKQIGVELFVMDDGWFKNRNTDTTSLGDWFVDKNKFPNGLSSLSKKIKSLGLQFGIWVEPEMISFDSDLFRNHPEYAQIVPNRNPTLRRTQLMLDMANPDVVDYLYSVLSSMIEDAKPDYIKWDYNRYLIDPYSSTGIRCGEYMHRFIMGTYELIDRLVSKYPNILFESCSSGGGRYDLGMCYYMPQVWGSDNTNSYTRVFINRGTLTAYPQSTFGAHVSTDGGNDQRRTSFDDRFNINCIGAFGYELDVRKLNEEDLKLFKKQTDYYKKHRSLIQFGQYYVIDDCFDDDRYYSFALIGKEKEEALLVAIEMRKDVPSKKWKLVGLDEKATYEIEVREQKNAKSMQFAPISGKYLMENGLDLGQLSDTNDKEEYPRGISSRMVYLKKIN